MIQPAEVTNDALLDAIRAVQREDTPPRRTLLYQLLLDSTLLVPMQPGKDAGPPTIRGASDEHGSWFPAFTSLDAMRRCPKAPVSALPRLHAMCSSPPSRVTWGGW